MQKSKAYSLAAILTLSVLSVACSKREESPASGTTSTTPAPSPMPAPAPTPPAPVPPPPMPSTSGPASGPMDSASMPPTSTP